MRRRVLLLSLLIGCSGGGGAKTDAGGMQRCCDDGTRRTIRVGACMMGEVGKPLALCTMPPEADAGMEVEVDSGPAGPACGDGRGVQGEDCERNLDCNTVGAVCRMCFCVPSSAAVEFDDAPNDLNPAVDQDVGAADLTGVSFTVDGPPMERIEIETTSAITRPAQTLRICLVVVDAGAEIGLLCYQIGAVGDGALTWTSAGGQPETIDTISFNGSRMIWEVPAGTVSFDAALSFFVRSELDGTLADRLPDEGTVSMSEIVGR